MHSLVAKCACAECLPMAAPLEASTPRAYTEKVLSRASGMSGLSGKSLRFIFPERSEVSVEEVNSGVEQRASGHSGTSETSRLRLPQMPPTVQSLQALGLETRLCGRGPNRRLRGGKLGGGPVNCGRVTWGSSTSTCTCTCIGTSTNGLDEASIGQKRAGTQLD